MKHLLRTVLLLLFISAVIFSQEKTYDKVDVMPAPVGGMSAISKNIVYPDQARKDGIEGKVVIEATIDKSGNVVATKIIKGVGSGLDEAAVKAVKMAKFTPAKLKNESVRAVVAIPIKFKLDSKKEK